MTKPLDLSKPVVTRDGRPVRILCTDAKNDYYPVIGIALDDQGLEVPRSWSLSGETYLREIRDTDLINAPETRTVWVVVKMDAMGGRMATTFLNKDSARDYAQHTSRVIWPFVSDPTPIELRSAE